MKIEINHLLCIFICSRLLSLHKLGVIRICPLLKSEYLFFVFAVEEPKFSASRAKGCCAFKLVLANINRKKKKVFLGTRYSFVS